MIEISAILEQVPHFDTFCSVKKLHGQVERLRTDCRFAVEVAGSSSSGLPIYHVRFGTGPVRVLVLGGVHAMEPIGSLTVFSLLTLLEQGNRALVAAGVEWHIVPCVDPDGTVLNEGWSQNPFAIENFLHHYYVQPRPDQVEFSFPISYKNLVFSEPCKEAQVLQRIIDRVHPEFCFSLHNSSFIGGTWFHLSRDIGQACYAQIYETLERYRITLQRKSRLPQYAEGMRHFATVQAYYDKLEELGAPLPAEFLQNRVGASSIDYILRINPAALVFVAELTYGRHPADVSERETAQELRQLKLRVHAENLFVAAAIVEEWDRVKQDLDIASPFFRKIDSELISIRAKLHEGITSWYQPPSQQLLIDPSDAKLATESDCVQCYGLYKSHFLGNAYSFVRLLKASRQTPPVMRATTRLERIFEEAIHEMERRLDLSLYELIDHDRLARVQLGTGLIALNSVLQRRQ